MGLQLHGGMRLQFAQTVVGGNPHDLLRERKQYVPAAVAAAEKKSGITLRKRRLKSDQIRPLLVGLKRPFPDFERAQVNPQWKSNALENQ